MSISINIQQAIDCYRKSDAVFIVCQNNAKKMIEIAALNEEATKISGYTNADLMGESLNVLLPERISTVINEFVEYDNNNESDLYSILGKVRQFAIRKKDGSEAEFKLRIVTGEKVDNHSLFHLVLVDEEKARDANTFRLIIKENFKGHEVLDPATGLPDRASIIKDLELITYYVRDKNIASAFAIIEINNYASLYSDYGAEVCSSLHYHISQIFRTKLRPEDTIGTLSNRSMGVILVGASQEEARQVLNRLRWAIGTTPMEVGKQDLIANVNIGFTYIDGKINNFELLEKCEHFMEEQRLQFKNSLQFILTYERREIKTRDRRQQSIPVELDRRRKDRRATKK